MVVYNRYINKVDHTWYDSSNLVYTACYDREGQTKVLKVVFKGGRTYIYKDVDVEDYVAFSKGAASNGEEFNKHIVKKYKGVRLGDTDLTKLDNLKKEFIDDNTQVEEALTKLSYHLELNNETGEFRLLLNDKPIYEGVEGKVSIINLFSSMHILYSASEIEKPLKTENDFENENIA